MEIGTTTYTMGIEITISTEPYELYGAMWQDGVDENGKTWTIKTNAQRKADTAKVQAEWKEQQAGFSRLKARKNS